MPRTRTWLARTDQIRGRVKATSSPLIDRASVQELFSLKPRQAANLIKSIGGEVIGGANAVGREALLAYLDGKGADPAGRAEKRRMHDLARALKAIRASGPTLRAELGDEIPRSPNATSLLPSGVDIVGPGRLEIRFGSSGDVLAAILRLAELSETRPAAFESSLEFRSPEDQSEDLEP
jgi:hypothetical protein